MSYILLSDALNNAENVSKTIKCSAAVPIELTDTVWEDLRTPASGINPSGSPSAATPNTTDGSLTFAKGNVAIAWFQMPHQWKMGTDIHLHIHWSKATTHNGSVHWQMKYKWGNIGDVMPAFSLLADGVEIVPNSNIVDKHALLTFTAVPGLGKTLSSMICVYLSRTNDGNDTFTGNCNLYEIDLHYEIDTLGSQEELIK